MQNSPRGPVYPEAFDRDLGVLQVDAVREQRLNVIKVLRPQLGHRGEAVVVLLDQVGHEVLVERQLVVPGNDHFALVGQTSCGWRRDTIENRVKTHAVYRQDKKDRTGNLDSDGVSNTGTEK